MNLLYKIHKDMYTKFLLCFIKFLRFRGIFCIFYRFAGNIANALIIIRQKKA